MQSSSPVCQLLVAFIFLSIQNGICQNCYRPATQGVFYRGAVSTTQGGCACLTWTTQTSKSSQNYPNAGLGDHSYCRNPQKDADTTYTKPWCFIENPSNCGGKTWDYCDVPQCEDFSCYSKIDKGAAYRGSERQVTGFASKRDCIEWDESESPYNDEAEQSSTFAIYDLSENKCRNPAPLEKERPWCFTRFFSWLVKSTCSSVLLCDDLPHIQTCDSGSGSQPCVFPFTYDGFTFVDCTQYNRNRNWCATSVERDLAMKTWDYCSCEGSSVLPTHATPTPANSSTQSLLLLKNLQTVLSSSTEPPTSGSALLIKTVPTNTTTAETITTKATTKASMKQVTTDFSITSQPTERLLSPTKGTEISVPTTAAAAAAEGGVNVGLLAGISSAAAIAVISTSILIYLCCVRRCCVKSKQVSSEFAVTVVNGENGYEIPTVQTQSNIEHTYELPDIVPVREVETSLSYDNRTRLADADADETDQSESSYWMPASTESELRAQIRRHSFTCIDRGSVCLKEDLGSGEFGRVLKGIWRKPTESLVVAVKMLNKSDPESRVKFLREAAIMGQFNHERIVGLFGAVTDQEPIMIVLEFMEHGNLRHHLLTAKASNRLPRQQDLLKMAKDIGSGMAYLASKDFVHRDLAARNILLDHWMNCKIGDFGMSLDIDQQYYCLVKEAEKIPVRWTALEGIKYYKYSLASDVWSFGVILFELWSLGKKPYANQKNIKAVPFLRICRVSRKYTAMVSQVISALEVGYRMPPPPGCPRSIYALMMDCWHADRKKRPKAADVMARLSRDEAVLLLHDNTSVIGDKLENSYGLYTDLQEVYRGPQAMSLLPDRF